MQFEKCATTKNNNKRLTAVNAGVGWWFPTKVSSISYDLFTIHTLIYLSTTWLHVILGLPRPLAPSFFHPVTIIFTKHMSQPHQTSTQCLLFPIGTLSLSDTPHTHHTICFSVLSSLSLTSTVIAHVRNFMNHSTVWHNIYNIHGIFTPSIKCNLSSDFRCENK